MEVGGWGFEVFWVVRRRVMRVKGGFWGVFFFLVLRKVRLVWVRILSRVSFYVFELVVEYEYLFGLMFIFSYGL